MEAGSAQGDLRLIIDESGLEAQLEFVPDKLGASWTPSKIDRLLQDQRVASIDHSRVDQAMIAFSRASAKTRVVVAYGLPPTGPLPETPEWKELAIPDELRHLADDALLAAPPPAVYKTIVETVRVERTVQKPGLLPFLPAKEEKVLTTEKRETRKRVPIDGTVRRLGYAEKGAPLAVMYAPQPGKPGKSIQGKTLPAPTDADTSFYLGSGVRRERNELFAEASGFVRIGDRWTDIIPLSGHRWEIERSADKATFLFSFVPGHEKIKPPDADEVLREAVAKGAKAETLIDLGELARAIAGAQAGGRALEKFSLSADIDSHMEVSVSEDRMQARLTLRKGAGRGKPLELQSIARSIAGYRFKPFDSERIKKALIDFYRSEETELRDLELATGSSPTRGKERVISYALAFLPDEKSASIVASLSKNPKAGISVPSLAEHPLGPTAKISIVQKGQTIAEISPPSFGAPGMDVFGAVVKGQPGNDPPVRALENVRFGGAAYEAAEGGIFALSPENDLWYMRVVPKQDAMIHVSSSADSMTARISLQAETGIGAPLLMEGILEAIARKGIKSGIDHAALAAALAEAKAGKPVATREFARGTTPVPPSGQNVRYFVKLASRGDARVGKVAKDACILETSDAGEAGRKGSDVFGNAIDPGDGARPDVLPDCDATIRVESAPDGTKRYYATSDGELSISRSGMTIRMSRSLPGDVDARSGHLHFAGSIHVSGGVASGYKVVGSGDVTIEGPVAASLVSSDGTILLSSGVRGSGKAVIRAKKHIMTLHAEQASLMAVDDIKIKNGCVACVVKTNGRIVLLSDKGQLTGGRVRARKGVEAQVLGSMDGQKTLISFGQDYLVQDMIEAEEREIAAVHARIEAASRRMADLERLKSPLDSVRADKLALMKLLEKHNLRVFNLREKFEEHFPCQIKVRAFVYPGVVLECHSRYYEITARREATVFTFDVETGRIQAADPAPEG